MYFKINIFIIRFYNLIHHLTIWQRSDVGGRAGGHGWGKMPLADPGRASLPVQEI